tara:strand:- start:3136 stop:3948 length:813 start_codon:yes stop_codon:yes gene_type:complete
VRNHFLRAAAGSTTSTGFPGVTDNLAVHWDFGDSNSWSGGTAVTDLTGNGNGGTLLGDTGGVSNADFSAQTDNGGFIRFSIDEDDHPKIRRDGTDFFDSITDDDFTLEFWVRPYWNANVSGTENFHIWTNFTNTTENLRVLFRLDNNNFRLRAAFHGSFIYLTSGNAFNISPNGFASNWSHIVVTRGDGNSSTYKTYVNNSLVATSTSSGDYGTAALASNRILGSNNASNTSETIRYQGDFGVYRFYNGKALTSTEVTTNYNVSSGRFGL